jgi:hypothetical protein
MLHRAMAQYTVTPIAHRTPGLYRQIPGASRVLPLETLQAHCRKIALTQTTLVL